ncbi:2408_t:CDS:2, partial [Gigaspora rosea]
NEPGTPVHDNSQKHIQHNIKESINLATHNIRGLNNHTKLHCWIDHCIEQDLHIISLSETKLKESRSLALTNSHYKIYTSNYIPASSQNREASLGPPHPYSKANLTL